MIRLLHEHQAEIQRLCAHFGVRTLEIFGSGSESKRFDAKSSDLDFLVVFQQMPLEQYADAYFGLLDGLQVTLGRPVDLVMPEAIRNPYFRQKIDQEREIVYAA